MTLDKKFRAYIGESIASSLSTEEYGVAFSIWTRMRECAEGKLFMEKKLPRRMFRRALGKLIGGRTKKEAHL